MLRDVVTELTRWTADGRRAAIATVVQVHGSAPLPPGTVMAVRDDGATAGAVSGGCVEARVVEVARAVAGGGASRRLRFAPNADPVLDTALPCGGGIDVLVESWAPSTAQAAFARAVLDGEAAALQSEAAQALGETLVVVEAARQLVLVGAGLVATAVARLAAPLGWDVVVVDPREAFAARSGLAAMPARAPHGASGAEPDGGAKLVASWPAAALAARPPLGPRDALVALSHHPALDDEALLTALASDAGFVGALGSRRSHADRCARLRDRGVADDDLARVAAPIGLDLGGWTPAEVALSIVAELVAVGHGRTGGRLSDGDGAIHQVVHR